MHGTTLDTSVLFSRITYLTLSVGGSTLGRGRSGGRGYGLRQRGLPRPATREPRAAWLRDPDREVRLVRAVQ